MWSRTRIAVAAVAVVVAQLSFAAAGYAQSHRTEHILQLDDPDHRPAATIDDLAWLAGEWEGEGFGGRFEETWGAPIDGAMVGTYRLMHDGATTMYEIQLIVEDKGSLVWKVKHFDPDLTAWEDKEEMVSFELVKIEPGAVYFQGLTLLRLDDDNLRGFISTSSDGQFGEVELRYRRVGSR